MKKLTAVVVLVLATILTAGGCVDSPSSKAPSSGSSPVTAPGSGASTTDVPMPHALLDAPGWTMREAIDGGVRAVIQPLRSSWYAEYQRLEPDADGVIGQALTMSGIGIGLDRYRSAMEQLGFSFEPVDTPFGPGLSGTTSESGARPVVVVVALDPGLLELLSYDESADQLITLLDDITIVDDARWRAAGGQFR